MFCAVLDGFGIWQTYAATLIAAFAYITLWFIAALKYKRIDIVDSAWGLGFVYVAVIALLVQPDYGIVQIITLFLISVWGLRLFAHITSRNIKKTEDARYVAYRKKWGDQFTRKAYVNIYLVQAFLIVAVSTPIIAIMNYPSAELSAVAIVGFVIWAFGIVYEVIGDYQLRQFLKVRKKGEIMQRGLWKLSRHPNYFGEITCWWGASLVALALGAWWGFIGATLITFVIIKISGLPPLEKRYKDDTKYQNYKKKTPSLMPFIGRKG